MPTEVYDVTVQRHRKPGGLLSTMDTVTYRVVAHNPAEARRKASKQAEKRFGSDFTITDQERRK